MPTIISSLTDRPYWKETVYAESPDGWHSEVRCRFPTPAEIKEAFQRLEQMLYAFSGAIPEPSGGDTWKSSHAKAHPRAMWPKFYKFHEGDYFEIYTRYQYLAKGEYMYNYLNPPAAPRSAAMAAQWAALEHYDYFTSLVHNYPDHPHDPLSGADLQFTLVAEPAGLEEAYMLYQLRPPGGVWGAPQDVLLTPPDFSEALISAAQLVNRMDVRVWFNFRYNGQNYIDPINAVYTFTVCDHLCPYGCGLPEFLTDEDDDHWDFEHCVRLPPQLINLARWALYYLGRWVEHDPRTRGSGNSCCWKENVYWRWTGSNKPGHYIAGGKGAADGAYPYASTTLHELNGGSPQKRK